MGDLNLKKNGSILLYLNISGLDSHFIFSLMGVLQLFDTQRQHNTFAFFTNIKAKNSCLKSSVNRTIAELLQCIE